MTDAIVTPEPQPENDSVVVGETFLKFENLVAPSEEAAVQLRADAISILSRAEVAASRPSSSTGLVVGHVQSGKTLSYEGVMALAKDNGFSLIVVITGISNPLLDQSVRRLKGDLGKTSSGWQFIVNPSAGNSQDRQQFSSLREDWLDPETPANFRNPIVAVVLKNHARIQDLIDLVDDFDWSGLRVLIIDDEADQASLNNLVQRGRESTTYRQLKSLRTKFPSHGYVQYTATPQAPLLIHIAGTLSPDYVRVLTPGSGYVGGTVFFEERPELVKLIPTADMNALTTTPTEPPDSFLAAMRVFYLGLAYSLAKGDSEDPKSMLIHPSRGTALHGYFWTWVTQTRSTWLDILTNPSVQVDDHNELVADFAEAWADLDSTLDDLPSLQNLLPMLKLGIRKTHAIEMNTRDGERVPEVDWDSAKGFVLVGGQALDRGFTVEGLTVTYMPRGIGAGNADTVQQRARFFGYKEAYLGLCRIYLEPDVRQAFEDYVHHEGDMHKRLLEVQATGASLKGWQRAFLLDASMKPTRKAVLSSGYASGDISNQWSTDLRPSLSPDDSRDNWLVINSALGSINFDPFPGHPDRTAAQTHQWGELSLQDAFDLLSSQKVVDPAASLVRTGLLLQLSHGLDMGVEMTCKVVRMRPTEIEERSLERDGITIKNLFQGRSRAAGGHSEGDVYPGDASIHDSGVLTIQVHDVRLSSGSDHYDHVPVLAVWVPEALAVGWYVQHPA